VVIALARLVRRTVLLIRVEQARRIYHLLVAAALGAFVYQLFNTDYWTGKLWLPIGLMLAAGYVLGQENQSERLADEESYLGSSDSLAHDILGS
jgi:hypothetical protein